MKNLFKPEDFREAAFGNFHTAFGIDGLLTKENAAKLANEKLQTLIESWPVIMTTKCFTDSNPEDLSWHPENIPDESSHYIQFCTHKARLAFIEPIVKKECKHEPIVTVDLRANYYDKATHYRTVPETIECKHCGVELQATWSPKE